MSLVAYDSSGDSDSDRDDKPRLLASLPPPKKKKTPTVTTMMELPRPRKRTEPVRIPAPEIRAADSDSDEDEPAPKKPAAQGSGGLSSLLPQPKNLLVKEAHRPLVPHSLTRRPGSEGPKAKSTPPSGPSPSPSAIKAAAKSAAMQLARQMAANEDGSDEEMAPENFFSLPEDASQPAVPPNTDPAAVQNLEEEGQTHTDPYSGSSGPEYHVNAVPDTSPQEYYGEGYYPDPDPAGNEPEESGSSSMFNDEAFRRLQGKQNRGREEIKFLEIKGDDQLSGNKQWMTKNLTNEVEAQKSFSKKKGEQPTGQQKRKHQITYLIHQAKARELELKNSWAENKMSRRQTQAKYGF